MDMFFKIWRFQDQWTRELSMTEAPSKSMDWFLCNRDFSHERVQLASHLGRYYNPQEKIIPSPRIILLKDYTVWLAAFPLFSLFMYYKKMNNDIKILIILFLVFQKRKAMKMWVTEIPTKDMSEGKFQVISKIKLMWF